MAKNPRHLGIEYFYPTRAEKVENFHNKNKEILANTLINPYSDYKEINLEEYYKILFGRNEKYLNSNFSEIKLDKLELPFENKKSNQFNEIISDTEDNDSNNIFTYNSILIDLRKGSNQKNKNWIITKELEELKNVKNKDFVITAPVTYIGRNRNGNNARYLYAFTIDLDYVGIEEMRDFLHQIQNKIIPNPNLITNSGNGLHITYLLENPYPLYKRSKELLDMEKEILTKAIWNQYTSRLEKRQYQNVLQGYRVPETKTKFGTTVTTFLNLNSKYWTIYELNDFLNKRNQLKFKFEIDKNIWMELEGIRLGFIKTTPKLDLAKEQWPEWYQDRIIDKKPRKYMKFSENLYKWWLNICKGEDKDKKIRMGHRYFCALALVAFATKCGIEKNELKRDLYSLLPTFDNLTRDDDNHFVKEDLDDALKLYGTDKAYKFKREYIEKQCGIEIPKRKRNGRTRQEHIKIVNATRKFQKEIGLIGKETRNKPSKARIKLKEYLLNNQDGKKKKLEDLVKELNFTTETIKVHYEDLEKEIFLSKYPRSFFIAKYTDELNKSEFFIFKTLIENPDLNKNQISQITNIGYNTISKYYPKIKNIIDEWKLYNNKSE